MQSSARISRFFIAVASIVLTLLILRTRAFVSSLGEICSIFPADAKNIGPEISYTRVCSGSTLKSMLSGSFSGSKSFQPSTCVTSLILFMKRTAARSTPTSIATTRSNITVRAKVIRRTTMSLLGELLTSLTNLLQPLMLYAT